MMLNLLTSISISEKWKPKEKHSIGSILSSKAYSLDLKRIIEP